MKQENTLKIQDTDISSAPEVTILGRLEGIVGNMFFKVPPLPPSPICLHHSLIANLNELYFIFLFLLAFRLLGPVDADWDDILFLCFGPWMGERVLHGCKRGLLYWMGVSSRRYCKFSCVFNLLRVGWCICCSSLVGFLCSNDDQFIQRVVRTGTGTRKVRECNQLGKAINVAANARVFFHCYWSLVAVDNLFGRLFVRQNPLGLQPSRVFCGCFSLHWRPLGDSLGQP
jgi:hypothetical protein